MGNACKILSLRPEILIIKKIILERNIAATAHSHVFPKYITIVYVNNAFSPITGADPTG